VSYFVEVRFLLKYVVDWTHDEGTNDGACAAWRKDDGLHVADVFNGGGGDPRNALRPLKPLKGRITIYARPAVFRLRSSGGTLASMVWGGLEAVGSAYGSKRRTWIQQGGPTATGCGSRFVRVQDDCQVSSGAFDVPVPYAAVYAAVRKPRPSTLKDLTDMYAAPPGKPFTPVLAVTAIGPTARPYRTCQTSPWAPGTPGVGNIGIPVSQRQITALRNLRVGSAVRVTANLHGQCKEATEIPSDDTCTYDVQGWVEIRRVQPDP
jgi:hypothetical protein